MILLGGVVDHIVVVVVVVGMVDLLVEIVFGTASTFGKQVLRFLD